MTSSAAAYVFMFAHYVNLWHHHFSHSERPTEQLKFLKGIFGHYFRIFI